MDKIRQVKYNKLHCTKCGEFTVADLVGFNFSELFAKAIEQQDDETWKSLVRLDLRFYYTIRDICQELHFQLNHQRTSELTLTVAQTIKQLEFLMNSTKFVDLQNSHRDTLLYNNIYQALPSNHGTPNEKMDDIETLIRTLSSHNLNDVIVSLPIQFIFAKDDFNYEIPIGIKYVINDVMDEEYNRVCPNCGERFEQRSGYHHEFIIGLAGLARVGKTAYLASLIHQLKKYSDDDFISISLEKHKDKSIDKFYDEIVADFEAGKSISKTSVENIEEIPLVYVSVKINQTDFNFVFVDMPGEIYNYDNDDGIDYISEKRHILKSADAIWCCIEPAMINRQYHNKNTEGRNENNNNSNQLGNLITTLNNLYSKKIPACIIVTQCDLVQVDYPVLFNPDVNVLEEYLSENNTLNITKMNQYVEQTRAFVRKMIGLEATIEDVFKGFSLFGVASYGFDVQDELLTNKVIKPSLVELPFLWTLASLGCLETIKINVNKNIFGKEKVTFKKVTDQKELFI